MGKDAERVCMALLVVNEMRLPKNTSNGGFGSANGDRTRTLSLERAAC